MEDSDIWIFRLAEVVYKYPLPLDYSSKNERSRFVLLMKEGENSRERANEWIRREERSTRPHLTCRCNLPQEMDTCCRTDFSRPYFDTQFKQRAVVQYVLFPFVFNKKEITESLTLLVG